MHETLLMLAMILIAALAGGRLAARFGYPSILGEIAAGILLGPPLLGILSGNETVDVLGEFGVLLMMLYIGIHLDLGDLRRASVPGLLAAVGGFIVPTALGMSLMLLVGRSILEALFVGLAMGVTSLATKSRILVDLKILDTRIAHVLVAGAVVSDVAVLVIFAAVVGQETQGDLSGASALLTGARTLVFAFGAWLVGGVLLPKLKAMMGDRELDKGSALMAVAAFGLAFAWAAELAGVHAILGAFIAGLFIDKRVLDPKTSRDVQQKLAAISIGVLAPFFFVSAGFEVSFGVFVTDLWLLIGVIVLATLGKVVGTALFYLPSRNGWREGVVVGAGMNGRGAVEIIVAEIALAQGLIDTDVFSILVFMALFTTATVPVLLTLGVRWLRRRGELVRAGDRTETIIVGAGPVARAIATSLEPAPVRVIDTNRHNLELAERLGLTTHLGNALDELTLEAANVESASRLIAATPNAEVNILSAQIASDYGVPEVCVVLGDRDASTFSSRLADEGVSVIQAPDEVSSWASALVSGNAALVTISMTSPGSSEDTVPVDGMAQRLSSPLFPIVLVSNGERSPFTTGVDLSEAAEVICIRRDQEMSRHAHELEDRSVADR